MLKGSECPIREPRRPPPNDAQSQPPATGVIMELFVPRGTPILPIQSQEKAEDLLGPGTELQALPQRPGEPRIFRWRVRPATDLTH